jgi:hypothetical protein
MSTGLLYYDPYYSFNDHAKMFALFDMYGAMVWVIYGPYMYEVLKSMRDYICEHFPNETQLHRDFDILYGDIESRVHAQAGQPCTEEFLVDFANDVNTLQTIIKDLIALAR